MKRLQLNKNLYVLQFEPLGDNFLGSNIIVLENEDEVILFDAGYQRHMKEAKKVFKDNFYRAAPWGRPSRTMVPNRRWLMYNSEGVWR